MHVPRAPRVSLHLNMLVCHGHLCPPVQAAAPGSAAHMPRKVLRSFVRDLQVHTSPVLPLMQPRSLTTILWAAAKLEVALLDSAASAASQAASANATSRTTQEPLTTTTTTTSEQTQESVDSTSAGSSSSSRQQQQPADAEELSQSPLMSRQFLAEWSRVAGQRLASFNMQDLSNTWWALGRLGFSPGPMFLKQVCIMHGQARRVFVCINGRGSGSWGCRGRVCVPVHMCLATQ